VTFSLLEPAIRTDFRVEREISYRST